MPTECISQTKQNKQAANNRVSFRQQNKTDVPNIVTLVPVLCVEAINDARTGYNQNQSDKNLENALCHAHSVRSGLT